jgi:hypothetical protein
MSYLNSLRLNFAGKFQAAPSTVNNDPLHYDNKTFVPSYQQFSTGQSPQDLNGWWNPVGDASWRLVGCRITGAWMNHVPVPATDMVYRCLLADSDRTVSAKLVDLDPEQQMVSEVWGMSVRICDADGQTLLRSRYKTAPFTDLWNRASGNSDSDVAAMYQSVLYDLEWGAIQTSDFLQALRRESEKTGKLSIKFNVDAYNMRPGPDFTFGRIVGTIGPCAADEPDHLVLGRHFMATPQNPTPFTLNYCTALVDNAAGKIYVDLGNALPTQTGGATQPVGTLTLAYSTVENGNVQTQTLEAIDYESPDWYADTAGVVEVPGARTLTAAELEAVNANPLALIASDPKGNLQASISEPASGLYARADQFVFRLQPEEKAEMRVYATSFGSRLAGARIVSVFDPLQLQPQSSLGAAPSVATPAKALEFPCRVVTDNDGLAVITLHASDPGNPRSFIDGQVYGIRPMLESTLSVGTNYPFNSSDFVSVLVFDRFQPDDPPTWFGCLKPVFEQYANLYPIMSRFLDMKDYDSVCTNASLLRLAFSLPLEDPNSMPVTRDLSTAKRAAIIRWLSNPGSDGKPRKGAPREVVTALTQPIPAPAAIIVAVEPLRGGKTAALARRLVLQQRRPLI